MTESKSYKKAQDDRQKLTDKQNAAAKAKSDLAKRRAKADEYTGRKKK